jgi:hypothetical protein
MGFSWGRRVEPEGLVSNPGLRVEGNSHARTHPRPFFTHTTQDTLVRPNSIAWLSFCRPGC